MTDQWVLNRSNFAGCWQGPGTWFGRDGSDRLDLTSPQRVIDPTTYVIRFSDADHDLISQRIQGALPLLPCRGQGQAQLRSSRLQPSRQGLTHIATTNDRQSHHWRERCDDPKDFCWLSR